MRALRLRTGSLLLALLAGCAVGPDFRPPGPPAVERYTAGPAPAAPSMPGLVDAQAVPADWWSVYGSSELDALVRAALAGSPTLDQSRAKLLQAQELRAARSGSAEWPQVDAGVGAVRQRIDPATFGFPQAPNPGPFNVFSLGANVSYDFDVFGGTRRDLEALGAEVELQRHELDAARLVLAGNVVVTAIRVAALDAQIEAVDALLDAQRRQLAIGEARLAAGGVSALELQNQRALLAQAETALPSLQAQRAKAGHLLAVLAGRVPAEPVLPAPRLAELSLPSTLPLRLPSELVRQRPDIRASEALLHKASANIGVATADLYPKFIVSGSFSSAQLNLSDVLDNGINVWNIGLNLLQPLFRGGELKARQRAAVAAYEQAAAAYRQSVLHGLQNVADALRALESDARAHALRSEQVARTDEAWRITRGRFDAGGVSQLALLDAERQRSLARVDWVQAQADRFAGVAVLLQAMGGGGLEPARQAAARATPP